MTHQRGSYRPTKLPWISGGQTALLTLLSAGSYKGSVTRLAGIVGLPDGRCWLALSGLAARDLVEAHACSEGVDLRITKAGRKYARG